MSDHDLISILQNTATVGPASQHSAQETLAAGRRSVARRRYSLAGAAMLSVAALGVVSLNLPFGQEAVVVSAIDPAAAAGDSPVGGSAADKTAPHEAGELNPDADTINAKILQAAMGPDFDVAGGDGSLRPGSASAKGLPTEFVASVNLSAVTATDNGMPQMCEASEEKGTTLDGCIPHKMTDGQIVQANFSRWAPTAQYPQQYAGESVRVFFRQANGVLVIVGMTTSVAPSELSEKNGDAARAWLKSMLDRMGAAATNPGVESQGFLQDDDGPAGDPAPDKGPGTADDAAVAAKKSAIAKEKAAAAEAGDTMDPAAEKQALAEKQAADEMRAVAEKQAADEKQMVSDKQAAMEKQAAVDKEAAAKEGSGPEDS